MHDCIPWAVNLITERLRAPYKQLHISSVARTHVRFDPNHHTLGF
ncbi:hypothetical protein HdK5_00231 [Escherichia phage vB_EcoM_HdK5]|uniref:Uncharacterized protein n=1 Tax=Escherichia phage vB_EcoM_HdK5 TaxID=2508197 RepID=A0A482MW21_9CAUD|nr:hypothetical protein HdK5_00231 [Escherichia phage vB_EcoM_HdK5]QXV76704.1 hypothetical protein bas48_0138 [Escherichia phage CarlMeissner]